MTGIQLDLSRLLLFVRITFAEAVVYLKADENGYGFVTYSTEINKHFTELVQKENITKKESSSQWETNTVFQYYIYVRQRAERELWLLSLT